MTDFGTHSATELDIVGRMVDWLRADLIWNRPPPSEPPPDDWPPEPFNHFSAGTVPTIEDALELGDSTPPRVPAVIIFNESDAVPEGEAPEAGAYQGVVSTIAVVHVLRAPNTKRGAGGGAPLVSMKGFTGWTRNRLAGFRPYRGGESRPRRRWTLQLARGRLLDIDGGRILWKDDYSIRWRILNSSDDWREV
ncbi:MAG: hypothetical protein OXF74_05445 [Rhodobacteraceae bacterium]|nr:hypothetical protein [Paracoccaceae bacterium]